MPDFRLIRYRGKFAAEWYEAGRRFRRSLGTDDRVEAARALKAFVHHYELSSRPERPTVDYAWTGYRDYLGQKPAATTMGFEWKAIGPHFGEMWADSITEADCRDYIARRRAQGRADGTIWTELGHLRSCLKWAEKKDLIKKAPAIYRPERPEPRDKRLTRAQARDFLVACEMPHVRLFVILALTTGARMSAILELAWDRIDFDAGTIKLRDPSKPATNKGRATVPMNRSSRAALLAAQEGARTRYVIEWGGHRVLSVKKAIQGAGKRAGLPWVTAHVFRHSAATWMAEDGVSMQEIAQYLGHSSSKVTERVYARFSPTHLKKAADSLEID